jgi:fluoride exporter
MTWLLVALGAAVGAPARYVLDRAVQTRHLGTWPWGTLTVNVVGSFVLGAVAAASRGGGTDAVVPALVGTGFCGALTTYSTLGYESVRLAATGDWRDAWLSVAVSTFAGVAAAALGWSVGWSLIA